MSPVRNALLATLSAVLASCTTTGVIARAAVAQQNTAVVLAFLDTVYNKHDVDQAFKLYVAPQYRQHNAMVGDGTGAALQALRRYTHEEYPELRQEVKRTIAQGDLVAVHSRFYKHSADRGGQARVAATIFRLEHGKIVEQWDIVQDVAASSDNDIF